MLNFWMELLSYRTDMRINSSIVTVNHRGIKERYYICPRCNTTLPREFMRFCDRCGQKIDWRGYKKAEIEYINKDYERFEVRLVSDEDLFCFTSFLDPLPFYRE